MPWFMVDDQFHGHQKVEELLELGPMGQRAICLWTLAGSKAQAQLSDGRITAHGAGRLIGDRATAAKLAKLLVKVGLWEDAPDGDGWVFHDWLRVHKPAAAIVNERDRRAELKRPEIADAVRARDGDKCRYCGRKVSWSDRRGDAGATYDHVDPGLVIGATNIVVACRRCNSRKARRTPEQAEMTLLPYPGQAENEAENEDRSERSEGSSPGPLCETDSAAPEEKAQEPRLTTPSGEQCSSEREPGWRPSRMDVTDEPHTRGKGMVKATVRPEGGEVAVPPHGPPPGPVGRAGPAQVAAPGSTPTDAGSPWADWHGPPPDVDEPTCPTHHLDEPCRKCAAALRAEEAQQP